METELNWQFIADHLPTGWRERAIEMGLVRPHPAHLGTKITDIEPVLRLAFHRAGLEQSLLITTGEAESAGIASLSSVAFHKWERKLGPYLASLLADLVSSRSTFEPRRWAGYEVIAVDATVVTCPSAKGTTARVHRALRLSDLAMLSCRLTDEHGGETLRNYEAHAGQLWLGDRIYANPPGIASIVRQGADVLLRYHRAILPLLDVKGEPFDVPTHVRQLKRPLEVREWPVRVRSGGPVPIDGRLCALRLPRDKADEARARLRREKSDVSQETLDAASWVIVFTTVPADRLSAAALLDLYRLRWQVELDIKRDKSLGGLDKLPNTRPDTIQTWLYSKLILQQIARRTVSSGLAFPPGAVAKRPASRGMAPHGARLRGPARRAVLRPAP